MLRTIHPESPGSAVLWMLMKPPGERAADRENLLQVRRQEAVGRVGL
jgi:hypothetical protein